MNNSSFHEALAESPAGKFRRAWAASIKKFLPRSQRLGLFLLRRRRQFIRARPNFLVYFLKVTASERASGCQQQLSLGTRARDTRPRTIGLFSPRFCHTARWIFAMALTQPVCRVCFAGCVGPCACDLWRWLAHVHATMNATRPLLLNYTPGSGGDDGGAHLFGVHPFPQWCVASRCFPLMISIWCAQLECVQISLKLIRLLKI